MANVGLIFFMFLVNILFIVICLIIPFVVQVGMELDPDMLRKKMKISATISTIGVIVPFVCSIPVAWLLYQPQYALQSRYVLFSLLRV